MRVRIAAFAALVVALPLVACGSGTTPDTPVSASAPTTSAHGATSSTSVPPTSTAPTTTAPAPPPPPQLPRGGRTIFPSHRVVAYYGGPDGPALGVLGEADPDTVAAQIEQRATEWAPYGRQLQPAMELIATVASPCTPSAPLCTRPVPDAAIQRYLDAAHRHKMLLILDFQPGRGEFLPQVQAVEKYLVDPSVSVALDPEWKLGPNEFPIQTIGSSSAASVNAVVDYLSALVTRNRLPDKLLVVHQFRTDMLPDRQNIKTAYGVENVVHADGFGPPSQKLATWNALAIPNPPFHTGFKLFLDEDTDIMSPAQVMALTPQPDLITYQ
ncbi:hypothetical protein ACXR2U_00135 [Jatrophihabitans sp. YIM 134969]